MQTREVLDRLEKYVYREIPYDYLDYLSLIVPSPTITINDVMERMKGTCWGRALVGYCILKNIGYEAYIVVGDRHAWLRVYENGSCLDTFEVGKRDLE